MKQHPPDFTNSDVERPAAPEHDAGQKVPEFVSELEPKSWLKRSLHILGGLWKPRLLEVACISRKSGAVVALPSEVLSGATSARIRLRILWPLWWFPRRRALFAKLGTTPAGEGSAGARARTGARSLDLKQSARGRTSVVCIRLPSGLLKQGGQLALDLFQASRPSRLRRIQFSVLDPHATRALLLRRLQLENFRLWTRSGAKWYPGELVPANASQVVPEFWVGACPLSAFLPPVEETVTINLRSEDRLLTLHRQPVRVGTQALRYRLPEIPIQNNPAFSGLGTFSLEAVMAGRVVARVRFRVLAESELLGRVRVASIRINVEGRDGTTLAGLNTLRWEEHRSFRPELNLEADVPSPDTLFQCQVRTVQGTTILKSEEFVLPLTRAIQKVSLGRVELGIPGLQARPRPARLLVSVWIGGEVKASVPVLVLPPEKVSNYEGQLRFDAQELPFEEAEYEQIVQRLGLAGELSTGHGFRPWLKRLLYGAGADPLNGTAGEELDTHHSFEIRPVR